MVLRHCFGWFEFENRGGWFLVEFNFIIRSSSIFKSVVIERYLYEKEHVTSVHRSLASYWCDKKAKEPVTTVTTNSNGTSTTATKTVVRKTYGFNQTLLIAGRPNERRISSVVWHLLNSSVSGTTEAVKTVAEYFISRGLQLMLGFWMKSWSVSSLLWRTWNPVYTVPS
ncbi:hypothetical protein BDR26DRAFT_433809 [Obelidium mucronatum]|nr:hypothetical protein BDR26DRAFT_433809 [Obelidium mucronatum]